MRVIVFLLTTLSLTFCNPCFSKEKETELDHFIEVRRLLEEEAVFLNNCLGFTIFGCGGLFVKNIETLELIVEVPGGPNMEMSRTLFAGALQDWINRVNADVQARPYYNNFPMTVDNFEFRMITQNFDVQSCADKPKIAFVFNVGDKIIYCIRTNEGKLTPFFRENLSEVLNDLAAKKALKCKQGPELTIY